MAEEMRRVSGSLSARVSEQNGAAELHLRGELDLESAGAVEKELLRALNGHSRLVLDLSDLTFMDSTGISVLVRAKREYDQRNADFVVRLGGSSVRRVLDLVRVTEFLCVED